MGNQSQPQSYATKAPPPDWPRISSSIFYEDGATAIDWLCRVFGFTVRLKVEDDAGGIVHSELDFGTDGMVMVGSTNVDPHGNKPFAKSPRQIDGGNTQSLCVFVDDVDVHCQAAEAAGARITVRPQTHDYGDDYWADRTYQAEDLEGHRWWFIQRVRGPGAE